MKIQVNMPDELHWRFKALCAKRGYSMRWAIRMLMIEAVNDAAIGEGLLGKDTAAARQQGGEEEG